MTGDVTSGGATSLGALGGGATGLGPTGGDATGGEATGGATSLDQTSRQRVGPGQDVAPAGGATALPRSASPVQNEAGVYVAPRTGPSDLAALPGPFTARQLTRIDEALTLSSAETGLLFSLYVGALDNPGRAAAERLAARLPKSAVGGSVLLAVSPGQRQLHIVTVAGAVKRVPNKVCALAALGMRAAFAGGDLTAGIVSGLRTLADAAGTQSAGHRSTGQAAGGR